MEPGINPQRANSANVDNFSIYRSSKILYHPSMATTGKLNLQTWGDWLKRTDSKRYRFALLMTGGTIVSVPNAHGALEPAKDPQELLRFAPHLLEKADLDIIPIINKDSSNMTVFDWREIVLGIIKHYNDYDGFLITHGTDTIAYSASAVRFGLGDGLYNPVVFTGSQLPINIDRTDAIYNLEDAMATLIYARENQLKEVFIVAGREVHRAVRAVKLSENAFRFIDSPAIGPVGISTAMGIEFRPSTIFNVEPGSSDESLPLLTKEITFDNRVLTLRLQPNAGVEMLEKLLELQTNFPFSAVVMVSLGTGNPPQWSLPVIESLIKQNVPVVIAPPETGMSTKIIYESARLASEYGAIQTGDMVPPAATVKLSFLLPKIKDGDMKELKKLFVKNFCGEVS